MFLLDGKPLAPDVPFTATNADGDLIQYPANWLRLSSAKDRKRVGITEQPDPAPVDFRFYWDTGIPKDHGQLVTQWVAQTRTTAGTLLAPSDWMIIREQDNATPVPADVKAWRESIRTACNDKVNAIEATTDTESLAAYITGDAYSVWPQLAGDAPADGVEPVVDSSKG
jgi:hypothetical protein